MLAKHKSLEGGTEIICGSDIDPGNEQRVIQHVNQLRDKRRILRKTAWDVY